MSKWNWEELEKLAQTGAPFKTKKALAKYIKVPRRTVLNALEAGKIDSGLVRYDQTTVPEFEGAEIHFPHPDIRFEELGNEGYLKYEGNDSLTEKDVLEMAGIDLDVWCDENQRVRMWQMGRKDKKVSMSFEDGSASGEVEDSGKIRKTNLFHIELKLTRKKRIAVVPALQPIEVIPQQYPSRTRIRNSDYSVLFICDPHFGFNGDKTIHHRPFLGSLLQISKSIRPDCVIWNGDFLDLADFSNYRKTPDQQFHIQKAGIESVWLLGEFRKTTRRQIIIEGNHDIRMKKALIEDLSAAYQLTPVHELESEPLMSMPRFLGLDKLDTEWIDGYPSAHVKIGSAKFSHGRFVRQGSGKTVAYEMGSASGSRFFGHIHRFELACKYVEDSETEIWVGSPGCACNKLTSPGASNEANWQLGAFVVHFKSGRVANVEPIRAPLNGPTTYQDKQYANGNYFKDFYPSIPVSYKNKFN